MTVSMLPADVTGRLAAASALSSLHADERLDAKVGLGAAAVTARLRAVSDLLEMCRGLRKAGQRVDAGRDPAGA